MTDTSLLDRSPTLADGRRQATFRYAGVVIRVSSAMPAPLAWLEHFMEPWFTPDVGHGMAVAKVELVIERDARHEPHTGRADLDAETAPCFLLDGAIVRHPIVERRGNELQIADADLGVSYLVQPGRVTIVARADDAGSRVALMRVVREMAVSHARLSGSPLIHSAVAAFRGAAIALCGPKRSGKTSLLLHMLAVPGTRFVANDRAISLVGDSGAIALGMPTITALRADSIERFPDFARALRRAPDRHWLTPAEAALRGGRPWSDQGLPIDLAPARFCELLDIQPVRQARLGALVFPSVDGSANGLELRRLTPAETLPRLRAGLVGATLRERPLSVFAPIGAAARDAADPPPADEDAALVRLAELPAYEARLGPNAYSAAGLPQALLRHVA